MLEGALNMESAKEFESVKQTATVPYNNFILTPTDNQFVSPMALVKQFMSMPSLDFQPLQVGK